jgi:hypothetical protein
MTNFSTNSFYSILSLSDVKEEIDCVSMCKLAKSVDKYRNEFAAQRFELWCGQIQHPLTEGQKEIVRQIVDYIMANGAYSNNELREENITLFAQMARNYGSAKVVDEVLGSLSGFMLKAG